MRIGIDLGGTKIEGIALEGADVLCRRRIPAPRGNYDATVRTVRDFVAGIQHETGRTGTVGIGIPGAISTSSGLVKNANSTWMIGKPLAADLERALGRPVRISNDANCFVLSEATDGAAKHARNVFGVIIGTGTGGGIVIDGEVIEGRHRIAGEWGHNPLPWPVPDELPGPSCYCGACGCIETFLSGPGLVATYAGLGGTASASVTAAGIATQDEAGEARASQALALYENRLARALAGIINVLDPDIIVLGGGLSNIDRLYRNVPALWGAFVFSDSADTPLVKAMHGDSSGVRGAAWLWKEGEGT
ncbi:MAG: ROK family protein [Vicinamibacterales bacterium]|nr:ROK family protein [Vicinamibacterales bacterium]